MARGRDLAGLAALAGLAYMANKKGKETTGVDPDAAMGATPSEDAGSFGYGDASGAAVDTAAMAEMGPSGAAAAPTRSAAKAPAARPNIVSREEGMKNYVPRRTPAANTASSSEEGMKNYVPRRKPSTSTASSSEEGMKGYVPRRTPKPLAEVRRPGTRVNYENADTSDMAYKKGGKTKKMASGGVASASKRADGIASRGKTKCKMY
jgi:hypothetical protein